MRLFFRRLGITAGIALLLAAVNWAAAGWFLCCNVDNIITALDQGRWPVASGKIVLDVSARKQDGSIGSQGNAELLIDTNRFLARVRFDKHGFELAGGDATFIGNPGKGFQFAGPPGGFPESRQALREAAAGLAVFSAAQTLAIMAWEHPFIAGWGYHNGRMCWRIKFRHGSALAGEDGLFLALDLAIPSRLQTWRLAARIDSLPEDAAFCPPSPAARQVPPAEIDRAVAESLRILSLQFTPVIPEPDRFARSGQGWLRIKEGRRLLHIEGTAHEIGYQHGSLLAPNVRRLVNRIVYGAGLYYSLEKGQWFPEEALKLCERQDPWIDPDYIEEMRGLAEGAGVPLADIRRANIFPEFFHCSGAALFGKATAGGRLLHARVLDYMTEVGLQDEAVVIAVQRAGALRWVNVSYAGFAGSVTGMNEEQIAIGEMGGRGEGLWDGTPMSFLLRGALENSSTLEEALAYMRDRKRTCEYYYVISDGKIPGAAGVEATPELFNVLQPGQAVERLPEAVPDAVLLSGGERYKHLVRRVRESYGRIDAKMLQEIIRRPVSMRSNLHDAIFEPQDLRLTVFDAGRKIPACDMPPAIYEWKELFP